MKKPVILFLVWLLVALYCVPAGHAAVIQINSIPVNGWNYGGTTATIRFFANQDFLTAEGEFVKQGNPLTGVGFFRSYTCTVSGTTLTIPTITDLPTNTDSPDVPSSKWTARFYDYRSTARDYWMTNFKLSHVAASPQTWATIRDYNVRPGPQPPPTYPTTDQVLQLISASPTTAVPQSRALAATSPVRIDGGGSADLSANRTLSCPTCVVNSDSRLTDTRTPTDATVTNAKVANGAAIAESKLNLASDCAAGTPCRRSLGATSVTAAAGNDARFPTANQKAALVPLSVTAPSSVNPYTTLSQIRRVFNVKDYDAVGDGVTNDTAAILLALVDALAARGTLYFPVGDYLVSGSGAQIFLVTKGSIELAGDGQDSSRVVVASAVANTVDVFRVSPPATGGQPTGAWAMTENGRDNRGLYIHDLAIIAQSEPSLFTDPYPSQPARHAITFDVSTAGQFLHNFSIERVRFGSFSAQAMYFNNLNGGTYRNLDGIYQFSIKDCIIRNGIKADFWGDSLWITNNSFVGVNTAIESTQVTGGAANLVISGNNITSRGGLAILHSGLKPIIVNNNVEMFVPTASGSGSNGAALDIQGDVQAITDPLITGNLITTLHAGLELDGVRLDKVSAATLFANSFYTPTSGTHYAIKTTTNATNTHFGVLNVIRFGTATLTNLTSGDSFPLYTAYTTNAAPNPSTAVAIFPGYLAADNVEGRTARFYPNTFAAVTAVFTSPTEGRCFWVTDSNTGTFGATITAGGGANHGFACYNGTNWTFR